MILIDREIYNGLRGNVKNKYVNMQVSDAINCMDLDYNLLQLSNNEVANAIISIIENNEKVIKKYGLQAYYYGNYPAADYETGIRNIGKVLIIPFDWSMADEDDESFLYTFEIAILQ
jgi:hypothetical protein